MANLAEPHIDQLQPFMLENAAVRGRIVRLGASVDTILSQHAYPEPISRLLAEVLSIASILAANLKQEGIITIQMRGNGPVSLLVADASAERIGEEGQVSAIALRGYAELAGEGKPALPAKATPRDIMGDDSYLAITYDPGRGMQRYQGVVALEGASLTEALSTYFTQSQQLDVSFRLAVDKVEAGWVAGGMMIERLASEGGITGEDTMEAWRTALAYTHTLTPAEMLDLNLPLSELLFRLYHEVGARVTPAIELSARCRCSRERIHGVLMSMPAEERAEMVVDGVVSVHCQFCNGTEIFTPDDLKLAFNQ